MTPDQLIRDFLAALIDHNAALEPFLHEDATLRFWGWAEMVVARPRDRVIAVLREETAGWPDPKLELFAVTEGERMAAEYRVLTRRDGRYFEHNRALFATLRDGLLHTLDFYAALPQRSARRKGYQAPATLTEAEVAALLEEAMQAWDPREDVGPNNVYHQNPSAGWGGAGIAHPGGNFVGRVRWSAEEADARIAETIARFAAAGIGFQWWVDPYSSPPDLPERLERHGLLRAGENARMARVGLADIAAIPTNPHVEVEVLDGSRVESIEEALQIVAECFHMDAEQVEVERPGWFEEMQDAEKRAKYLSCLARLDGKPVGFGRVVLKGSMCHLGGAATLPDARGRHVYATLLRRRLEAAHERGFNIATIDAGPMSRRVVEKYGFKVYGLAQIYGWMPEMDPAVIKTLVPDD